MYKKRRNAMSTNQVKVVAMFLVATMIAMYGMVSFAHADDQMTPATYKSIKNAAQTAPKGWFKVHVDLTSHCVNGDCDDLKPQNVTFVVRINTALNSGTAMLYQDGKRLGIMEAGMVIKGEHKKVAFVIPQARIIVGLLVDEYGDVTMMSNEGSGYRPVGIGTAMLEIE